jgi:uncharacterized flavoprotein (TIGR03862 family)
MKPNPTSPHVAIIGAGPAGLMAAEVLAQAGVRVDLYERMPSVGRKFLLAGVGGMNITHSEAKPAFINRYGERAQQVSQWLEAFDAEALRAWIHGLGIDTFVGTSGRVFPTDMKAAPLLRAWLKRLRELGVQIHTRQHWLGWSEDGALRIESAEGELQLKPDACVLALGGASWPRLGSDGAWVELLRARQVQVTELEPSNCGFEVNAWSAFLRDKFAGAPLKNVSLNLAEQAPRIGEFVLTDSGIEGSLVYALSADIRRQLNQHGSATVYLDLLPQTPVDKLHKALSKPRGSHSLAKHLHRQAGIDGVKSALLRELVGSAVLADPAQLSAALKALPITLVQARPLAEAISTAGGVSFAALEQQLMLSTVPGTFCAGEMLDWEAPTGGYLLTACFASGRQAASGVLNWLATQGKSPAA